MEKKLFGVLLLLLFLFASEMNMVAEVEGATCRKPSLRPSLSSHRLDQWNSGSGRLLDGHYTGVSRKPRRRVALYTLSQLTDLLSFSSHNK
ncbi:hypothetical protein ACS0TY_025450 [Phlomoides rotata]